MLATLFAKELLSIAKLQNLKAIHNRVWRLSCQVAVVINRKTTKFESNSQLPHLPFVRLYSCYQSQNYKIWKQFTTKIKLTRRGCKLLSIAKLQNLKAIHNWIYAWVYRLGVVINRKTTKFESNSQQTERVMKMEQGCYQSQNYKIWKQFTT